MHSDTAPAARKASATMLASGPSEYSYVALERKIHPTMEAMVSHATASFRLCPVPFDIPQASLPFTVPLVLMFHRSDKVSEATAPHSVS